MKIVKLRVIYKLKSMITRTFLLSLATSPIWSLITQLGVLLKHGNGVKSKTRYSTLDVHSVSLATENMLMD